VRHLILLVVEDEFIIAESLQESLEQGYGATVVGPCPSVSTAMAAIESGPTLDAAILDVNLSGERSFPVVDELQRRGIPFVLVTGYDQHSLPVEYQECPTIQKPTTAGAILRRLGQAGLNLEVR